MHRDLLPRHIAIPRYRRMEGGDFLHLLALLPGATLLTAFLVATARRYNAEMNRLL